MNKKICVFCSSSNKIDKVFFDDAEIFAKQAVQNGYAIVCGGGVRGLMGKITHVARENKGTVIGIMPEFMRTAGWGSEELNDTIVVNSMSERKIKMIETVDAIVALAGGVGTLDEIMEVVTLKTLGKFTKPIVILNTEGFYNHLQDFFQQLVNKKFASENSMKTLQFIDNPNLIFEAINNPPKWDRENTLHLAIV